MKNINKIIINIYVFIINFNIISKYNNPIIQNTCGINNTNGNTKIEIEHRLEANYIKQLIKKITIKLKNKYEYYCKILQIDALKYYCYENYNYNINIIDYNIYFNKNKIFQNININ